MSIIATHAAARGNIPRQISTEEVCDLLARFIAQKNPNGATPNEEQVVELTRWINRYLREPWDEASIGRYRKADAIARHERETLAKAAAILQRDLNELKALNGIIVATVRQRIAELETAIAVLGKLELAANGSCIGLLKDQPGYALPACL